MTYLIPFSFILFLLPCAATAQEETVPVDTTAAVSAAREAAHSWLTLLDAGKIAESHEQAAASFRGAVSVAIWRESASAARAPFLPLGDRTVLSTIYTTEVPGVPGPWVIIDYRTSAASGAVVERVSMTKESDGVWRAGGYWIRPS